MKIFNIITPRRVAVVALAAAIALAVFAEAANLPSTVLPAAVPLLLLAVILRLRGTLAAWAGALAGLGLSTFWLLALIYTLNSSEPSSLADAIGWAVMLSVATLIGLAGFLSELPHLRHPHGPKPAH